MRVGIDVSPLVQTRGGHGALPSEASSPATSTSSSPSAAPAGPADRRPRRRLVPARAASRRRARGLDVLHCPTFRGPFPQRRSRGSNGPRPRRPAPPGDVQPVVAALQPPCRSSGGAGGEARDRRLRVHAPRARRAARRARGEDPRDPERRRRRRSRRTGPPPRATTCSRSARSSRARTSRARRGGPAARRRAARRRRARLGAVGGRGRWAGSGASPTSELAELYRGARCLVYPSLYEGFGIPVLEAMACGTPVVTSAGGATEEVAGGAAVLVDPLDPASIAAGIEEAPRAATSSRARPRARARLHLGARRGGDPQGLRGGGRVTPLVVVDADVLGRGSAPATRPTSRTCSAGCRRSPATTSASPRSRAGPTSSPRASSRSSCRRASRSCGWPWPCRGCCGACGPRSPTSSTRCRSAAPAPRS